MSVIKGNKEYFKGVGKIKFEGKSSKNPLSYRYYDKNKYVLGKPMKDHFKFAIAYWHSFTNLGNDPFGIGTKYYPWLDSKDVKTRAYEKMDAAFEFISKLDLNYFCFHDFDLIDEADSLSESTKRLEDITDYCKIKINDSKIKPLWGTANLFSHPRYMNGAATNPDFEVVSYAGSQVKNAIDATIKLKGENYVFWGGREGYMTLLNTDMKKELDNLATFLHMAKDYGRANGFKGHFFIEPKPMEPSKHQYDFDAATVIGFLREYDLMNDFKLNIEVNHATLASHTFDHELQVAANANMLGSIDANRGDYQNGWDTDQFPNNIYEIVEALIIIIKSGGINGGGINFDAKTRRNSTDLNDLFHAHIGSIDLFARSLLIVEKIINDSEYSSLIKERYSSFH
ncbi:MAG: xylose isomerase, partial [Bacteroidota bacterium]|nr:xylose isomerase [Bacteroidota bacterium]